MQTFIYLWLGVVWLLLHFNTSRNLCLSYSPLKELMNFITTEPLNVRRSANLANKLTIEFLLFSCRLIMLRIIMLFKIFQHLWARLLTDSYCSFCLNGFLVQMSILLHVVGKQCDHYQNWESLLLSNTKQE